MTLYLRKANNALCCHCNCEPAQALISGNFGQLDCPWCGCGWLVSCLNCRRAFSFMEAVEIEESLESVADRNLRISIGDDYRPAQDHIAEAATHLAGHLERVELGRQYVYLDGLLHDTASPGLSFVGLYGLHDLPEVPHMVSGDTAAMTALLNRPYWQAAREAERSMIQAEAERWLPVAAPEPPPWIGQRKSLWERLNED